MSRKEAQIEQMSLEAVLNELKDKRLPTYGTAQERKDRLKKQYGITPSKPRVSTAGPHHQGTSADRGMSGVSGTGTQPQKRVSTTDKIDQIKINREARRLKMEEARKLKSEREANNEIHGIKVDVDYQAMVEQEKDRMAQRR